MSGREKVRGVKKVFRLRHYRKNHRRRIQFTYTVPHWEYITNMCKIVIVMIWDVIWTNDSLFSSLNRHPIMFNPKTKSCTDAIHADRNKCKNSIKNPEIQNFDSKFKFYSKIDIRSKGDLRYVFSIPNTRFFIGDI